MRIGIDIDDTICCSIENTLPYICEFYGLDYYKEKEKCNGYDDYHLLPNYRDFANMTYEKIMFDAELKEKANYYINCLSNLGHEIIIITARSSLGFKDPYGFSKKYLDMYDIHYDKIIVGASEKGRVCREENIDIFIDDNLRNCFNVEKEGINVFLFDNAFNRDDVHFERVNNWEDVYVKITQQKKSTD